MADVVLRPIRPDDEPFLRELYAAGRVDELAAIPWSDDDKARFLAAQFAAQTQHYQIAYAEASFDLIEIDGRPAGRRILWRGADEIRVVDIALMPPYRSAGTGTRLLREVMAVAAAAGLAVRLHCERVNPALVLYERLGFRLLEDKGVYLFLEWRSEASSTTDRLS